MIAGNTRLSRRRFLLMALASLTTGCSSTGPYAPTGRTAGSAGAEPVWLAQVIGDPEAAARLGHAWLAAHPGYNRGDMLVADIQQALARYDAPAVTKRNPQRTVAALQQLVRHEYVHGETEAVAGWILSVTEARLYALAALR